MSSYIPATSLVSSKCSVKQNIKTKKGVYRVYANGVRALKHPINCRVQLQKPIVLQCFKPAHDEKTTVRVVPKHHRPAQQHSKRRLLRPVASYLRVKHGPHAPARAENIQRLGEAVVVDDPGVDGEDPHQQDDVAARKHHVEHLPQKSRSNQSTPAERDSCRGSLPRCRSSGPSVCSPWAPGRARRRSWVPRGPCPQTWPQTERGRWWWCMELETRRGDAVGGGGIPWEEEWCYNTQSNKRVMDDEEVCVSGGGVAHPGWSRGRCPFRRHPRCSGSLRWICWSCCRWEGSAWSASCWGWKARWSRSSPDANNNAGYPHWPSSVATA